MNVKPIIMKFGGTSVQDTVAFKRVPEIIASHRNQLPIVVVSAMSGFTDALVMCAKQSADGELPKGLDLIETHLQRHLMVANQLLSLRIWPPDVILARKPLLFNGLVLRGTYKFRNLS
ncbi:MAG: hypothetical protein ABR555_16680 [Pyrinomonadaceae bacterium]